MKSIVVFLLAACVMWTGGLLAQEIEFVGSLDNLGWSNAVFVQENYAYLACEDTSFYVVDISDPFSPIDVGCFDTPEYATDVFVVDSIAYVIDMESGLYILDISDPTSPTLMSHFDAGLGATGLFVSGSTAFIVADDSAGYRSLQLIDVSDPVNPVRVGTDQHAQERVFVEDGYAYTPGGFCDDYYGCGGVFGIIDVIDPSEPLLIGSYHTGWNPGKDVFVCGNYAYFVTGGHWLFQDFGDFRVIDISDRANPVFVGGFGGEYSYLQFTNVFKQEDYAFVIRSGPGDWLLVLDVSSPQEPVLETAYDGIGGGADIFVLDNYIYLAGYPSLTILRFIPTDIDDDQSAVPSEFSLSPAHPNPFNSSTTIEYALPRESDVTIEIYDILGRRVETLVQGQQQAGYHQVVWDAGSRSSGLYFYRVEAGKYTETRKMVLLK
jgi:hypothetical protein